MDYRETREIKGKEGCEGKIGGCKGVIAREADGTGALGRDGREKIESAKGVRETVD